MWVSKEKLEDLEQDYKLLRSRIDTLEITPNHLIETIDYKIDEKIGYRVVSVAKDEICVELFNKLKDNMFGGKNE